MTLRSPTSLNTKDPAYSSLLLAEETAWWKRLLDVQRPYRWNLRRLNPCFTLDIGCGIGRNLINLDGNGIGIDHNEHSVAIARYRGLHAYTPAEFRGSSFDLPERFDSILLSHVAEHMSEEEAASLLKGYVYLLRPQGQVILITPQECGQRADPTHVQFMDFERLRHISRESGLVFVREFSFPFPRAFGRLFRYNEFVSISRKA
ncbi:MAG: methyltransferase domain-containing protein [Blastocatellia bacterium]